MIIRKGNGLEHVLQGEGRNFQYVLPFTLMNLCMYACIHIVTFA